MRSTRLSRAPSCRPPASSPWRPGVTFDLAGVDTRENGGLDKGWAEDQLRKERARISDLQEKLYAERRRSLLIVLQAIDTGGKDGTIRAVLKG